MKKSGKHAEENHVSYNNYISQVKGNLRSTHDPPYLARSGMEGKLDVDPDRRNIVGSRLDLVGSVSRSVCSGNGSGELVA